jgi:hypothetical protein
VVNYSIKDDLNLSDFDFIVIPRFLHRG